MPNLGDMFAIKLVEYISNLDAKSEKNDWMPLEAKGMGDKCKDGLTWMLNLKINK